MAVVKACEKLRNSILEAAAGFFNVDKENIEFDGKRFIHWIIRMK